MEIHSNLREISKRILGKKLAIYKEAETAIIEGLWEEFERLVRGTAQYTGTTAASWNIAAKGAGSHGGVREQTLAKGESPLKRGHSRAVDIALKENKGNLDNLAKKVLTSGINVWNESDNAETGVFEHGPLREVNAGGLRVFATFQHRVMSKVFRPLRTTKL